MSLTTKELLLIQDNIKMAQNSINFLQGCANFLEEQQVKNLCQNMVQQNRDNLQTLSNHINSATIQ